MKKMTILSLSSVVMLTSIFLSCATKDPYTVPVNRAADTYFLYLADPYILLHDSTYYMYGTNSDDGFQVFESEDLKNWSRPAGATKGFALWKDDAYGEKWFWAPEVYYKNNQFYMFYTASEHMAVAVSDSPKGPFKQIEQKPLIGDFMAIDPHLYFEGDKAYIYYVTISGQNTIWVAEMSEDLISVKPETAIECFKVSQEWEMSEQEPKGNVNEGPFVQKQGDYYYMSYSANHFASQDYGVGYAVATSPIGPWTKHPDNPILQSPGDLVGTGHHSIFTDKEGRSLIAYHAHNSRQFVLPRVININEIHFADSPDYEYPVLQVGKLVSYKISR